MIRQIRLDDWTDGKPGWDYEAVLKENAVEVVWDDQATSDDGKTWHKLPDELCGWAFSWKHGAIEIGRTSERIAREAAAVFVSLWLLGVSASFANKLVQGYVRHLEIQENFGNG